MPSSRISGQSLCTARAAIPSSTRGESFANADAFLRSARRGIMPAPCSGGPRRRCPAGAPAPGRRTGSCCEAVAHRPRRPPQATPAAASRPGLWGARIIFRPDPTILDGRVANNGWLQTPESLYQVPGTRPRGQQAARGRGGLARDLVPDYRCESIRCRSSWCPVSGAIVDGVLRLGPDPAGRVHARLIADAVQRVQLRTSTRPGSSHGRGDQTAGTIRATPGTHARKAGAPIRTATLSDTPRSGVHHEQATVSARADAVPDHEYTCIKETVGEAIDLTPHRLQRGMWRASRKQHP